MAAVASYETIAPSNSSSHSTRTPSSASTRPSVVSACCCSQCLAACGPLDFDDCPECVRWRVQPVPGLASVPLLLPAPSTQMSLRGGSTAPTRNPPPPRPPPALMPLPPVTVTAAAALQPLMLQPSPPPPLVDDSGNTRIVDTSGAASSPLSPLLLEDEVECQQREPIRPPHLEVTFTRNGAELHPPQQHQHAASSTAPPPADCVELQSIASEALRTHPLSSYGTLDEEAEMLDIQPGISPQSHARKGSGGAARAAAARGDTSPLRDPIPQLRILGLPSPIQSDHEAAAYASAASAFSGARVAVAVASPLVSSSGVAYTPSASTLPTPQFHPSQQTPSQLHFHSFPHSLASSPIAVAAASSSAPKRFSSSSFLQDSVESPPPDFQQHTLNDLLQAQDRPPIDTDTREQIRSAAAAAEAAAAAAAAEPQLEESSLTSIGDVSSVPSLSSERPHSYEAYTPLLLHEEFADVRIGGRQSMQDVSPVVTPRRRGHAKRSPANNRTRGGINNQSAPTESPHNTRRKGRTALAVKTDLSHPSTPEQPLKRLQTRRNSDVASLSSARMHSGSDSSSAVSSAAGAGVAASSFSSSTAFQGASRRSSWSHKRKLSEDSDRTQTEGGDECASCAHCAECAKHWRDVDQGALVKHDPDHGHVHSRASAPSSPHAAATAPAAASALLHPSKLSLPPSHAAPPLHPPSPGRASRNHFGSALKANHAVRTAESMTDSPQHVSLALSPSLRSRRLHHSMRRGHVYEVECILDIRVRNDEVEFLVAWKGYPDLFQSWEPAHSLQQACSTLIGDFEESRHMDDADDRSASDDSSAGRAGESSTSRAPSYAGHSDEGDTDEDMREAMQGAAAAAAPTSSSSVTTRPAATHVNSAPAATAHAAPLTHN